VKRKIFAFLLSPSVFNFFNFFVFCLGVVDAVIIRRYAVVTRRSDLFPQILQGKRKKKHPWHNSRAKHVYKVVGGAKCVLQTPTLDNFLFFHMF